MNTVHRYLLKIIPAMYVLYLFSLLGSMGGMEIFSWGTFILITLVWLYEYFNFKKNIFPSNPLNKYVLLVGIIMVLSVILSPYIFSPSTVTGQNVIRSERNMLFYLGKTRIALLFFFNLIILERFLSYKTALKYLSYFLLPMALIAVFMAVSGFDPIRKVYTFNWVLDFSRGIRGFFVHYIEYVNIYLIYFFIMLGFVFLYKIKKVSYRTWLILSCVVVVLSMVLSGTRAVFVSIPLGIVAMVFFSKKKKILAYSLIVMMLTPVLAYSVNSYIRERVAYTIKNVGQMGDDRRYNLWRSHLQLFKDYPILGVGYEVAGEEWVQLKSFEKLDMHLNTYDEFYHPLHKKAHNMFVFMLSAAGILGFVAFMLLLTAFTVYLYKTWSAIRKSGDDYDEALIIGLIGALTTVFCNMIVDCTINNLRITQSIIFAVSLVAYLGNKYGVRHIFKKG